MKKKGQGKPPLGATHPAWMGQVGCRSLETCFTTGQILHSSKTSTASVEGPHSARWLLRGKRMLRNWLKSADRSWVRPEPQCGPAGFRTATPGVAIAGMINENSPHGLGRRCIEMGLRDDFAGQTNRVLAYVIHGDEISLSRNTRRTTIRRCPASS